MRNVVKHSVVRWFTTSTELRQLANEMDTQWAKIQPGQTALVSMHSGDDVTIEILIDQEKQGK